MIYVRIQMIYISMALIFFSTIGCQNTAIYEGAAPGMRVERALGYSSGIRMNSVAILDDSIQQWYIFENSEHGSIEHGKKGKIAVEMTNSRRSPTGTLEVWAILRNRTDYDLQIEGRVQFFDQQKGPVEGPTSWKRIMLPANSVANYKEFSTNIYDIAYYYIEIREGR